MKDQITIGRITGEDAGDDLLLDVARLINSKMVVQANSGGGKSWLLRLLLERVAAHVPVIVLDREGEYSTLREKLDLVLVGSDGEVAAHPRSARLLARKLIELGVSAVVDLSELDPQGRRDYVRDFLESLIHLPRDLWRPTVVAIDEAHEFCPEKGTGEASSTKAVIDLMSLGRKRGFCGLLATQRFSKLHNDALAEALNVVIGRTWLEADQKRAGGYLGMDAATRRSLRSLGEGEFFAFGPALSFPGVTRFRSGEVSTSHPQPGERHLLRPPRASEAIKSVVKQLADLPEQAEAEARDVETLRAQLDDARREIKRLEKASPPAETKTVTVPLLGPDDLKRFESALGRVSAMVNQIDTGVARLDALDAGLREARSEFITVGGEIEHALARARAAAESSPAPPPADARAPRPRGPNGGAPPAGGSRGGKAPPRQRILDVLASLERMGLASAHRTQVAAFTGYSDPTSRPFREALKALHDDGQIAYPDGGQVALTPAGRTLAGRGPEITSAGDLHRAWESLLPHPRPTILRLLIAAYPNSIERRRLATASGYGDPTSRPFREGLVSLRTLGLIDYPAKGDVAATRLLFPEGMAR